ncbi:hypothetical protein [Methylosinus sp. PW1]|nr:hypothetical protein [Methylosinus sp. PW1]
MGQFSVEKLVLPGSALSGNQQRGLIRRFLPGAGLFMLIELVK